MNKYTTEVSLIDFIQFAYGEKALTYYFNVTRWGEGDYQRRGQAFMNVLRFWDPENYNKLSGSLYDCFYDDNKIHEALNFITTK